MSPTRRGRPATGWTVWRDGAKGERWYTQITLKSGKRSPWIPLPKNILRDDEAGAKAAARLVSDDAREGVTRPRRREGDGGGVLEALASGARGTDRQRPRQKGPP